MVHLMGRYDDEFGSARFDRPSTGSQGAEEPDEGPQVRGRLEVAILQALFMILLKNPLFTKIREIEND